jgi:hypothetical protein
VSICITMDISCGDPGVLATFYSECGKTMNIYLVSTEDALRNINAAEQRHIQTSYQSRHSNSLSASAHGWNGPFKEACSPRKSLGPTKDRGIFLVPM